MDKDNLNEKVIHNEGTLPYAYNRTALVKSHDGDVEVIFDGIKERLIQEIKRYGDIVGCVAWLRDPDILEALATRKSVSICIQKEDWLRPDSDTKNPQESKARLKATYEKLPRRLDEWVYGYPLYATRYEREKFDLSEDEEMMWNWDPIRCVGRLPTRNKFTFPRMHNKFLVFGEEETYYDGCVPIFAEFKPLQVWTGSFNFTKNASNSFENVLILKDSNIVQAYYREWQHIMLFSEDLDWFSDGFNPDWKLTDP